MSTHCVPWFARTRLRTLAGDGVTLYYVGKISDFIKYIVRGNCSGVIHLHDTRNNVKSIRYKQSDGDKGGTNVILREDKVKQSVRLVSLQERSAYSTNSRASVRDALALVGKLLNAAPYQAPPRRVVGLSGVRRRGGRRRQ